MKRVQLHIPEQTGDVVVVAEILLEAEQRFALVDTRVVSRVEGTLFNYSEGCGFGFGLGARRAKQLLLVEFNLAKGNPEKFERVMRFIRDKLTERFGDKVSEASSENWIPAPDTLPITDEMRAFHRRMIGG